MNTDAGFAGSRIDTDVSVSGQRPILFDAIRVHPWISAFIRAACYSKQRKPGHDSRGATCHYCPSITLFASFI